MKHPPCSAQDPGPSQEVIVSLSREPWSGLGDSERFQSLPSWPVTSGDDLGHRAHRQKIQPRNCYCSTCKCVCVEYSHTASVGLISMSNDCTLRLLKICVVTALVEGVISWNRMALRGCYKYKHIKGNIFLCCVSSWKLC